MLRDFVRWVRVSRRKLKEYILWCEAHEVEHYFVGDRRSFYVVSPVYQHTYVDEYEAAFAGFAALATLHNGGYYLNLDYCEIEDDGSVHFKRGGVYQTQPIYSNRVRSLVFEDLEVDAC